MDVNVLDHGHSVIIDQLDGMAILKKLERIARVCYNSEDKITETSAVPFIKGLIKAGHESVIEHESFTVKFVVDRGISHELVRHRLASFTQRSQRYVDESSLNVILPHGITKYTGSYIHWLEGCEIAAYKYCELLRAGHKKEIARSVLPNCTATVIYVTANLREWRWIMIKRTAKDAHPDMQAVMVPLLLRLQDMIPVIFDDINEDNVRGWRQMNCK